MTRIEGSPRPVGLTAFARARFAGLPRPFWFLWSGTLVNRIGTMVEPFLAFYLAGVRGLSVMTTGAVMALFGFGSVVSQLVAGAAADRLGRRATLTIGMLANAVSLIALGYAATVPAVVAAVFLVGLTIDLYRPASQALVADLVPGPDRPRAYGLLFWAVNLGFAVAMVAGGGLARVGFRWLFWVDALTCAAFGALAWRALPETRSASRPGRHQGGGFRDVFRDTVMVAYTLIVLGYVCVYLQAYSTLPLAMQQGGLSATSFGLAMAVNGAAIVILQPLVGTWLSRWDHSLTLAAGMTLVGVGFGLTSLASSTSAYCLAVLVWTLGEIAFAAVASTVMADLAPAHLRGRYAGVFGAAWSVGSILAPLGGTRLLALGPSTLWLTCAGICVVAAAGQVLLAPAIRRRQALLSQVGDHAAT